MYKSEHFTLLKVYLEYSGLIFWTPNGQRHTICSVEISLYPFDTQKCELIFSNWVYTGGQVNLTFTPQTKEDILEMYQENGEWDVMDISVERQDLVYDCCPDDVYPQVTYTITMKRKILYYIMNLILPMAFLSFMTLMVFHIPPEAGERLSVGITLLLSYFIFLLMIFDSLPNTSESVALIGK